MRCPFKINPEKSGYVRFSISPLIDAQSAMWDMLSLGCWSNILYKLSISLTTHYNRTLLYLSLSRGLRHQYQNIECRSTSTIKITDRFNFTARSTAWSYPSRRDMTRGRQNLKGNNKHQGRIAPYLLITIFMLSFDDILFNGQQPWRSQNYLRQNVKPQLQTSQYVAALSAPSPPLPSPKIT